MKLTSLTLLLSFLAANLAAQAPSIELYDLVKKLVTDSTGYENIGDWAVGKPQKFPVKWAADKIEMSNDTAINFYRQGKADVMIKGKTPKKAGQPVIWNIMLKGPRMGYSSFAMLSSSTEELSPKPTIDSVFGKKPFTAKLLKTCDTRGVAGYSYYEVKFPKKDLLFLKISWINANGLTAIRLDGYDAYSKYAAKLACAN